MKKIIIMAILLMAPQFANAQDDQRIKNFGPSHLMKVMPDDHVQGAENAKVTIIEYSSLSCPHCSDFHRNTYEKFKEAYIDKGLVRYVYRDFPTNKPAVQGALLSYCAGKEKYFDYIKTLMNSQMMWAFHANYEDSLINIGKLGGMKEEVIKGCLSNALLEERIIKRAAEASKELEINHTPTFFINGDRYSGSMPYKDFTKIVDDKLNSLKK